MSKYMKLVDNTKDQDQYSDDNNMIRAPIDCAAAIGDVMRRRSMDY